MDAAIYFQYINLIFNTDMQKHFVHFGLFFGIMEEFLFSSSVCY